MPAVLNQFNPDYTLIVNTTQASQFVKSKVPKSKIIVFNQHDADQEAVRDCTSQDRYVDKYVFVSEYQKQHFVDRFGIDPNKIVISRNAMPTPCHITEPEIKEIITGKEPTLVYTSTPFRGLDKLIEIFPYIKKQFPQVTLKVFSSLQTYQADDTSYQGLYDACRDTDGVEYIGSVSQTALAEELKKSIMYFYPNTFAETSCIAVIEAMSTGNYVVTSNLGALPETTCGFGQCVKPDDYLDTVCHYLGEWFDGNLYDRLEEQIKYYQENFRWENRARDFLSLLES